MDLRYSDRDEKFRAEFRVWLAEEVPRYGEAPPPGDWPARRAYDCGWQRRMYEAGYAGVGWPEEYGGRGATLTEQLVYYEEISRSGAPYIGANFVGVMHAGPTLMAEGSEAQKAAHVPGILRGEQVWCQGFSEPSAGSDLASLRTRAVRDGDEYVVNGHKLWTTRGQIADYCEMLVRTDPEAPKHRGISWLIVPMDAEGIEIRPLKTLQGEGEFSEVFYNDVRVPEANRVGEENDGWRVANVTLRFERGTAFGQHIASLQSLVHSVVAVARRVARGDASAWSDRGLRREAGRLQSELDALWALVKLSVSQAARSPVPPPAGSAIKLAYSELYQRVCELAQRVLGRAGLATTDVAGWPTRELLWNALWSIQFTISGGTSQIQRNIVAERVLGQPRDR